MWIIDNIYHHQPFDRYLFAMITCHIDKAHRQITFAMNYHHAINPYQQKNKHVYVFIQHFARNWPWYSLHIHIHILMQPAYPYHLVFLIWYPYSLVFLIWYPYALISLYGNTAHCFGCGVAMGCYGLSIVPRTIIVMSQLYDRYCFAG